ncbi:MAG: diaminopimelate decarboxylase [Catenisphaera adipataccumulans]|jgi:diaminopimelate decarboxylase|uniref:diaminopimelate decarboxylase n=1 Tax=Catenisphaera adipataccumulans TaxID=700500 RepID=UPI003D8C46C2
MIEIAGMSVKELADTYQTPLMVYDENKLRQKMSDFMHYFQSDTFETGVLYASKAFSCKEILRLANEYRMCLDVVSGGELYTAGQVNFPMERVYFHGNNKSLAEMKMAIEYGVGTIIVDNLQEAQVFNELAKNSDHVIHILLRINPGIDAHTHKYIVTGHVDSKFGVSMLQEEEIVRVIKTFDENEHTVFEGFHAHIGSQIFDKNAFAAEIKKMFGFVKKMEEDHGIVLNTVNLGGGFAATYTDADAPIPLPEVCATILDTAKAQQDERQTHVKKLLIEPGRSIVAEAGSTIYTAGFTKQTPNKNYVFVDGGMADNIRPALYQAAYDADVANKDDQPKTVTYTIAGKCCESGDLLIEGIKLPPCQAGDLIIVYTTGAYGYSMASHYNKLPLPAVVFVKDGKARVVIERESYEHMIALEK